MLFAISDVGPTNRPDFRAELMAERLIERRLARPFPMLWVAMFRPVEPLAGAELVLAIHYQTRSIQELPQGDWFTARTVHGFAQESGWTTYRQATSHRLGGVDLGPAQFVREG